MNEARSPASPWPCWCASLDQRLCWRTARFGLARCSVCGCYRIDPPPLANNEECETFYDDYYEALPQHAVTQANTRGQRASRFWEVALREPALMAPGQSAVDVGCGEGQLCAELADHGWRTVTGLDVSKPRVRRARQRHPHLRFYTTPLSETDVVRGSVDLVVMDNVIEHLPFPLGVVRELRPYLSAGGRLVIITPNMESGHFRLLGRRWTPELAPHAHIYLFTGRSLRRLLVEAGYAVQVISSFHQPAAPIAATLGRLVRGDVKGTLWRAVQDMGGIYGQLIGAGSMLYAVATVRTNADADEAGTTAVDSHARRH